MEKNIKVFSITSNFDVIKLPKDFKVLDYEQTSVIRFWIEWILPEEVEYKIKKYPFYQRVSDEGEYGPIRMLEIKDLGYVSLEISVPKNSIILGITNDYLNKPELLVLETKDTEKKDCEFIIIDFPSYETEVEIPFGYIFHSSYFYKFGLSRTRFLYRKMSEIARRVLSKMESGEL
jgi:hypothetical protein